MNEQLIEKIAEGIIPCRHDMHRNPQTAYEETYASNLVSSKLREWDIRYTNGFATTGLVATIEGKTNTSGKVIGLRADMDALDIQEETGLDYASVKSGKMHACGHDGHTAILLATAQYLNETRNFDGTVHLIFQPAEEMACGANAMIEQGLFDKFPCDELFAIHNWPYMPLGQAGVCVGPIMAAADLFTIKVTGTGGHAGTTEVTSNAVYAASAMQLELLQLNKELEGGNLPSLIQTTNVRAGTGSYAIVPSSMEFFGTVRTFDEAVQQKIKTRMQHICDTVSEKFDLTAELEYDERSTATIKHEESAKFVAGIGKDLFGPANFNDQVYPASTAEDFGAMLEHTKGAYIWVGQGEKDNPDSPHSQPLHAATYDFNDNLLPYAMKLFVSLVEKRMPL